MNNSLTAKEQDYSKSAPSSNILNERGILVCVGFGLWLASYIISDALYHNEIVPIVRYLRLSGIFLAAFNELIDFAKYRKRDYVSIIALVLLVLSALGSERTSLLTAFAIVFLARNVRFDRLLEVYLVVIGFLVSAICILSYIGYLDQNFVIAGGRLRSSLGFTWPSAVPNYLLTLVMALLLRYGGRINYIHIIGLIIAAFLLYSICGARAPFIITVLLLIGFAIVKSRSYKRSPIVDPLLKWIFVLCAMIVVLMAFLYSPNSSTFEVLNAAFSNRLQYSHNAVTNNPITLFGSGLFGNQNDYYFDSFLDSGYLSLLYIYGLTVFVILILAYTRTMSIAISTSDSVLILCLFFLAIHSIVESQLLMLQYTPMLLLLVKSSRQQEGEVKSLGKQINSHANKKDA